ncbi:hypothetical protein ACFL5V_03125 [Fibrobacterota bacterium]
MNTKFIHIGCHKCGSTFIQGEVLPKLKHITPVSFMEGHPVAEDMDYLVQCGELYYDTHKAEDGIQAKLKASSNICLSSEALSGTGVGVLGAGHQIPHIASRLRRVFGEVPVLILIRNQKSAIESLYKDDVKYGFLMDYEGWFTSRTNSQQLNYFKYSPLIECYQKCFGEQNVKVFLFEELFSRKTIETILQDFDIEHEGMDDIDFNRKFNDAYSSPSLIVARWVNRLFGSKLTYGVGIGRDPGLRAYNFWRYSLSRKVDTMAEKWNVPKPKYDFKGYGKLLRGLFQEDNKRTEKLTGKQLKAHGYIV